MRRSSLCFRSESESDEAASKSDSEVGVGQALESTQFLCWRSFYFALGIRDRVGVSCQKWSPHRARSRNHSRSRHRLLVEVLGLASDWSWKRDRLPDLQSDLESEAESETELGSVLEISSVSAWFLSWRSISSAFGLRVGVGRHRGRARCRSRDRLPLT